MATLPTPEESARATLAIFKAKGMRPGGILQKAQVHLQFTLDGGKTTDFTAGLKYAVDAGWIELRSSGTALRLTDQGFALN
jgi:hypothetical protein